MAVNTMWIPDLPRYILVTGSRDWRDYEHILHVLVKKGRGRFKTDDCLLIEGGARGADRLCRQAAIDIDMPYHTVEADWDTYGRSAGPIRNQWMVDLVNTHGETSHPECGVSVASVVCLAFPLPQSIGTYDMMRRCELAGIEVVL